MWQVFVRKLVSLPFMVLYVAGSVGDAISITNPDVYISDDGGYTWSRTLEGPHHYAILDSGGIIVAVEQTHFVNEIKYARVLLIFIYCEDISSLFASHLITGYSSLKKLFSWYNVKLDRSEIRTYEIYENG